jgi:hypothetical protein
MTLEQAQTAIAEIHSRTDIGAGQKAAMTMRVISQFRRANPDAEVDALGF